MAKETTTIPEPEPTSEDRRSGALGRREDDNDIMLIDDELRDGFAMAALDSMQLPFLSTSSNDSDIRADYARAAWAMADAMMAAR